MRFISYKKALTAVLISICGLLLLAFLQTDSLALRGDRRDHISQLSSAVVIDCVGFNLFKLSPQQMFEPDSSTETLAWGKAHGIPSFELFKMPTCTTKPLAFVWPHMPRPYGPGVFVLLKPIALLWQFDFIDFRTAQYFTFFLMLFFASLSLFIVHEIINVSICCPPVWFKIGALAFFAIDVFRWALNGQFDSISIFFLLSCFLNCQKKSFTKSLFYLSLSFFFQFRTLFWMPLGFAILSNITNESNAKNRKQNFIWLFGTFLIGAIGLSTFILAYSPIQNEMRQHVTNPIFLGSTFKSQEWVGVIICCSLAIVCFLKEGFKLTVIQLGWLVFMLSQMPYVLGMHALFVIPVLFFPFIENLKIQYPVRTFLSLLFFYSLIAGTIFTNNPFELNAFKELAKAITQHLHATQ